MKEKIQKCLEILQTVPVGKIVKIRCADDEDFLVTRRIIDSLQGRFRFPLSIAYNAKKRFVLIARTDATTRQWQKIVDNRERLGYAIGG